jgi:hypothetical protein
MTYSAKILLAGKENSRQTLPYVSDLVSDTKLVQNSYSFAS